MNFDGYMGTVKTVSGGRVIVDFNHPLAGRDIDYEVTVKRIVSDVKEKVSAFMTLLFGQGIEYVFDKGLLTMKVEFPEPMQKQFTDHVKKVIPDVKKVVFTKKKEEVKKVTTQK